MHLWVMHARFTAKTEVPAQHVIKLVLSNVKLGAYTMLCGLCGHVQLRTEVRKRISEQFSWLVTVVHC